ncbi:MAG: hypothetical protein WBB29_20200, partial [Geitlerinemataceae cyanobacterium]
MSWRSDAADRRSIVRLFQTHHFDTHPMRNSSIRIESFFQRHRDSIIGISSAAIVFGVWGSSLIWL